MSCFLIPSRTELAATFYKQHLFSRDYSPLYASLFHAVYDWLVDSDRSPVVDWLLEASSGRRPLDVSILLTAALHRDILLGESAIAQLARYYPSAGGNLPAGQLAEDDWSTDQEFRLALQHAILARRDQLRAFIRSNQVQTNETGRGISWFLPASLVGWTRLHLLDLGASAGLNLVANKRNFRFIDAQSAKTYLQLGDKKASQIEVRSYGDYASLPTKGHNDLEILTRLGCDINPLVLQTSYDEATLSAFVWGDQTTRLDRLREGIAVLHRENNSRAPVRLHTIDLPDGLPDFLQRNIGKAVEPLICYNTFVRAYLPHKGAALGSYLESWANEQVRPVVWIQWEPPSHLIGQFGKAPEFGWLAWTVDMWHRGIRSKWHIAWVHPHGQQVYWLPALQDWIESASAVEY